MHEPRSLRSTAMSTAAAPWHVLHRDYETRSRAILRKVGANRYANDPSTEILCAAYAVDDDPVQLWVPGNPVPLEFIEAARNPRWVLAAHGDHFENHRAACAGAAAWLAADRSRAPPMLYVDVTNSWIAGAAERGGKCA